MKKLAGVTLMVVGLIIFLSTLGSCFSTSSSGEKLEEVRIDLQETHHLLLESTSIDIRIEKAEGNELIVEVEEKQRNQDLIFDERGDRITVKMVEGNRFSIPFFKPRPETEMIVFIPEQHLDELEIKTVSGDVSSHTRLLVGDLHFRTTSGDIEATEINASQAILSSTSGNVVVDSFMGGQAAAKTVSGDIEIGGIDGDIDLDTVSGDILVTYTDSNQDAHLKTVSGDIEVLVQDLNATLDLKTTSGDIEIDEMLTEQRFQSRRVTGTAGNGDYMISSVTTSGDMSILKK
ncbi:DUF4097 family beta strand repeat-containing protein [Alkalihalophilus lindianensis]|uniref:DUF4097 family beta strand repeat-containing protein n=1 Tax=Alkalihalophilus lindianensis TaxID=1630542 RepID=A0ABU3XEI2_9BACI|nr:DUF4097 family beta strand repeat-containing protein [Alkalihalophilus lindianensis]MDV2686287.1 DUF4097 family beta strand repeat-containing protein [Alkalihalophilus lindianensis]